MFSGYPCITLNVEEVKGLFIDAPDKQYYAAGVNKLMLHGQRAAVDLITIQLWTRECYASNVKFGVANGFTAVNLNEEATEEQSAIVGLTSIILVHSTSSDR
ncbi:hypothetical protein CYMTET_17551 [Cymbomonas tetramitiformis]|uniref:Uncharacterized protein n=1 Tax=Cymbomonas tetramitiformis TaxID=36881 RepID=A0AAE0GA38_9CHLO|nr:hypothetical protein CYMTET_17551 [Cymbomonas tetramitiformis]